MPAKPKSVQPTPPSPLVPEESSFAPTEGLEDMLAADAQDNGTKRKNSWLYGIGIVFAFGVLLIAVGVSLVSLKAVSPQRPSPVSSSAPELTPMPSPTPETVRSDVAVEVLNASGIAGAAGKLADTLETLGYTVVKTGNAPRVKDTTVAFGRNVSDTQKQILTADLVSAGVRASISGVLTNSTASARIMLGE